MDANRSTLTKTKPKPNNTILTMRNINLPTLPYGYRLAEPGEIIKEGWGSYFDGANLFQNIYLPSGWLLLNSNSMAVGLQVGEGEIYICPIFPPSLHLPFTEADPLPEGKEGDYLMFKTPFMIERIAINHSEMADLLDMKGTIDCYGNDEGCRITDIIENADKAGYEYCKGGQLIISAM